LDCQNIVAFNGSFPGKMDIGFHCSSGSTLALDNANATGFFSGDITTAGYVTEGQNAFLTGNNADVTFAAAGYVCQNGTAGNEAKMRIQVGVATNLTTGVTVGANAEMEMNSVSVASTSGNHLTTTSASSVLEGTANIYNQDQLSINSDSLFGMTGLSRVDGDDAFLVNTGLTVGTVGQPSESVFGGGDSYTNPMFVRTTSDGISFNDYDSEAASASGSTFPPWPGTGSGNIMYIGTTLQVFPGFVYTTAAGTDYSGGTSVIEYWNGSAWTDTAYLITLRNAPYSPTKFVDINASTSYQIRIGPTSGWTTTTIDGQNAFWLRWRITSAITTVGLAEQVKLHTSRLEINRDGFVEYFGTARTIITLDNLYNKFQSGPITSPGNQDLLVSDTLVSGFNENAFSGTQTESAGLSFALPFETCTSCPMRLTWQFQCDSSGGRTSWTILWGFVTPFQDDSSSVSSVFSTTGSAPGTGPNQQSTTLVVPTAPTAIVADKVYGGSVLLDIRNVMAWRDTGTELADTFWVTIRRNGGSGLDTNNSDANVFALSGSVLKWCDGRYAPITA